MAGIEEDIEALEAVAVEEEDEMEKALLSMTSLLLRVEVMSKLEFNSGLWR